MLYTLRDNMHNRNTALLLIDIQKGFDEQLWGERNNGRAEENIVRLLTVWREKKQPVLHVKHNSLLPDSPLHPSNPGNEIKDNLKPLGKEPVFVKTTNSA